FVDIVPTVLELCGVKVPRAVQGKSLAGLLAGKVGRHRGHVIAEYSENEEAMVRTERWKLIYCTGKRKREDGYHTGAPLPGRTLRLYDLERDPDETTNLAGQPEQAKRVRELTALLAQH